MEIRADILSEDTADVKLWQTASATAPVLGQSTLAGTVKQIYPQADHGHQALGVDPAPGARDHYSAIAAAVKTRRVGADVCLNYGY